MCTLYPVIFFRFDTQKNTAKAPAVDIMRLNTLRINKTALLTPKRYVEYSRHFYMGAPPPPPSRGQKGDNKKKVIIIVEVVFRWQNPFTNQLEMFAHSPK